MAVSSESFTCIFPQRFKVDVMPYFSIYTSNLNEHGTVRKILTGGVLECNSVMIMGG